MTGKGGEKGNDTQQGAVDWKWPRAAAKDNQ